MKNDPTPYVPVLAEVIRSNDITFMLVLVSACIAWFPAPAIHLKLGTNHDIYETSVGIPPRLCYSAAVIKALSDQFLLDCGITIYRRLTLMVLFEYMYIRNINIDKETDAGT